MLDLHLDVKAQTAERLTRILNSYPDSETFAQNVISQQITDLRRGILNFRLDLRDYEDSYQMASDEFYEQFSAGKLDDRETFILWSGLYEMLQDNVERLHDLL